MKQNEIMRPAAFICSRLQKMPGGTQVHQGSEPDVFVVFLKVLIIYMMKLRKYTMVVISTVMLLANSCTRW